LRVVRQLREERQLQGYFRDYLKTALSDEAINEALRGDRRPRIELAIHAHGPTQLRRDASGAAAKMRSTRISRGCLASLQAIWHETPSPSISKARNRAAGLACQKALMD